MKTSTNTSKNNSKNAFVLLFTLFLMLYVLAKTGFSQEAAVSDSVVQKTEAPAAEPKMNNAMTQVMNELKSGSEDSVKGSVFMIVAVLGIVGVAMYMSFKSDDSKKQKTS